MGQQGMSQRDIVEELSGSYEAFKRPEITTRRFTQNEMLGWLKPTVESGTVHVAPLGNSSEGRTISLYTYGEGSTKVLLWSQMHGDEPTATMALLDILNFLARRPECDVARTIKSKLSLFLIPMLNPDGAERFTRRTAQFVDMNRDAVALKTPEARILLEAQETYQPEFGFNLHDQEHRLTVGPSKNVTAIALLAPAVDPSRSDNHVRRKAKKVASVFAEVVEQLVPGHCAKYDDTFEVRAFGDTVQKKGTSTVLVESGGWQNDREKMFIRKLNYVGLLTSLYSIATGEYDQRDAEIYEHLPFNSKNLYDVIVRGVRFKASPTVPAITVDIAFNLDEANQDPDRKRLIARVVDLGDLSPYGAFEEREGGGITLSANEVQLEKVIPWEDALRLLK
ncbi:MAG TPA: M14 family zinc carboxypeptidase [Bacteroidota bacterium]